MFTFNEIQKVISMLSLPDEPFIRRRVARALSIPTADIDVERGTVLSQSHEGLIYHVNFNSGTPSCSCPDGERTIYCKHRLALLLRRLEE